MIDQTRSSTATTSGLIKTPAYPHSARELFRSLREILAREHAFPMTFPRLGQLLGRSTSVAHFWFNIFEQRQIIGFMCLLERLPLGERHRYIDSHCRVFPTLQHPSLAHAPQKVGKLMDLLQQRTGLTIISGGTDTMRTFVASALGHTFRRVDSKHRTPVGIDLHTPNGFVPVESLLYLDGALDLGRVRQIIRKSWPRMMTSNAPLLIFNRVWSSLPEVRGDILGRANDKHVILAEAGTPNLVEVKREVASPIHVLTLSEAQRVPGGIRVNFQRVSRGKRPE